MGETSTRAAIREDEDETTSVSAGALLRRCKSIALMALCLHITA